MMRKLIKLGLILVMLASFNTIQTPLEISGETEVIVMEFKIDSTAYYLNNDVRYMDVWPTIINDRTLLPARYVVEPLGGDVAWNQDERKATCILEGTTIEMWIDNPIAKVNGNYIQIDEDNINVKPTIIDERTFVPIRFLAESLDCETQWDPLDRIVTLTFIDEFNVPTITTLSFDVENNDPFSDNTDYPFFDAHIFSDDGVQLGVINSKLHSSSIYGQDYPPGSEAQKILYDADVNFEVPYFEYYYTPPPGQIIASINISDESETVRETLDTIPFVSMDFPIAKGSDLIESYPFYDCMSKNNIHNEKRDTFYDHFIRKCEEEYLLTIGQIKPDVRCSTIPGDERIRIMVPTIKYITIADDGGYVVEYYNGSLELNIETVSSDFKDDIDFSCDNKSFQESLVGDNYPKKMLIVADRKYIGIADTHFNDLADYAQWRTSCGVETEIVPLHEIISLSTNDTETSIKDFVKDIYINDGLDYLLLVGDTNSIPAFSDIHNYEYWCDPFYTFIGSYMYTDTPYGNFGDNSDDDFISEIAVGRIPLSSIYDLKTYMNKAKIFEQYTGNRNKALFSNGVLFDVYRKYGQKEQDDYYIYDTRVAGTENDDLPVKHGKDMIEIIKKKVPELENTYEMEIIDSCCEDACMDRVYSAIKSFNPDIINFGYHSKTMISGGLDGKAICNDHPSLFYNIGCFTNNFGDSTGWTMISGEKQQPFNMYRKNNRSFSENVLFSECNNCAGYIGNSSFGFYRPWHRQRQPSLDFQIEFFKELLRDDNITIGEAFKRSKNNMYVYCIDEINEAYRWVYDGLNLLGDPSLKYHNKPVKLRIEPNAVDLNPGQSQRFEAKLFDKHGNPTSGEVEWSVAPEGVGQFWGDGMFTATSDTDTTGFITATCGDLVGYACVHVITENPVPRSINICRTEGDDPRNISFKDDDQYCIQLGYDALFKTEIYDQFGEKYPLQHDMRWATNNRDVIDILYEDPETCRLFPKMKGKCTLTVIYEGLVDSIEIEVSNKCGSDTP